MPRLPWSAVGAGLAFALAVAGGRGIANEPQKLEAAGHAILAEKCARCHAIEKTGDSPLAQAPAFRDLHKKYPVANIAEALAEGIVTGHPDMPSTPFVQDDIDAIIAYIEALSR